MQIRNSFNRLFSVCLLILADQVSPFGATAWGNLDWKKAAISPSSSLSLQEKFAQEHVDLWDALQQDAILSVSIFIWTLTNRWRLPPVFQLFAYEEWQPV